MAAEDLKIRWGSLSSLTITNLNSLADANIWYSAAINDASPHHTHVMLSYTIEFNATPVAGDHLALYLPIGNGDGTILWPSGLADTEGALTTAGPKAEFLAAVMPFATHPWQTDHTAIFKNNYVLPLPAPDFRFAIRAVGEAIKSTGNTVKYKLGTAQRQTS